MGMKLEGDSSLHFVPLRMTDNCLPLSNSLNACHSERSEESYNFN
jgi:hypothetical protein